MLTAKIHQEPAGIQACRATPARGQFLDVECRRELKARIRGTVLFDVPMNRHCTFGVGGPADAWVEPQDEKDLAGLMALRNQWGADLLVVGQGSNLLVHDAGIRGIVVRLAQAAFRRVDIEEARVIAGAGISNAWLLEGIKAAQLGGLEFLCGIPGVVGGGVATNAGAAGACVADKLTRIRVMGRAGNVRSMARDEMDFEYRGLHNLGDGIVLDATFELRREERRQIQSRIDKFLITRIATQPKGCSAGCVFKNPNGQSAGKIIDSLGLKGMRVGGACVSMMHGNFILNDGKASSRDVMELIDTIRAAVLERTGIMLETEIRILGG